MDKACGYTHESSQISTPLLGNITKLGIHLGIATPTSITQLRQVSVARIESFTSGSIPKLESQIEDVAHTDLRGLFREPKLLLMKQFYNILKSKHRIYESTYSLNCDIALLH